MKCKLEKLSALVFALTSSISMMGHADGNGSWHGKGGGFQETVFTLSNNSAHNQVLAFQQYGSGHFKPAGIFSTGGKGTGSGLGNQGALALSDNERFLFAVNPGSNDISVFKVNHDGLTIIDRAPEPGLTPVSITVKHKLVYVVNSGDDSIFGFKFDPKAGKLTALPNSHQQLSGTGTGPAQISFNPDGNALVVTEKATNKITSFTVDGDGTPTLAGIADSTGQTPFGFAFGKRDQFFVSNAHGNSASQGLGTVSSYELNSDGAVQTIDDNVTSDQAAACWLVTTPGGRLAFTADTPANAISSFSIDRSGHVTLQQSIAATEKLPGELAVSPDGRRLYTLNGDQTVGVYKIQRDGNLNKLDTIGSLPAGANGLVVR